VLASTLFYNNCLTVDAWLMVLEEQTLGNAYFSLIVPEDLAEWLDKEAMRQCRTRNNLINWILQQYRNKPKSFQPTEA